MKHKVLTGNEQFSCAGSPLSVTVKDFWAWSMSQLMGDGPVVIWPSSLSIQLSALIRPFPKKMG